MSVGDFVLVNNCDDPDNEETGYIAQVDCFFDTGILKLDFFENYKNVLNIFSTIFQVHIIYKLQYYL